MENTFEEDYPVYCKEKELQKPVWIQKYCVWIDGHICDDLRYSVNTNDMDKIGNLFDTKEEAEKAVEKLKAWKRLKDKGFKFDGIISDMIHFKVDEPFIHVGLEPYIGCEVQKEYYNDLMLLFGGKND